jgi:outer membrane protein assembly factor BamB
MAPAPERESLYIPAGDCLYAVNAGDGTTRWSQQVKQTRNFVYRTGISHPPPRRMTFAVPRAVNGVVYVCIEGNGAYICAFDADDGSLRWRTATDGRVAAMPFMDWAVPLVSDGVVYSGTYALNEQDGSVLWQIAIDTREEGTLSLHALANKTIYATTHRGVYAINAQNGQIRWLYQPDEQCIVSGPPVVAGRLLYAGASGSIAYPESSYFSALDVETGAETWRYSMGPYIGAVVQRENIYVSSGDGSLYALDAQGGVLRWRYQFGSPGHYPVAIANDILYINRDGAYALRSEDGAVRWRQSLEYNPSVSFTPSVVLNEAVYLSRIDGRGQSVLYALNTDDGAECWHTTYPCGVGPLAIAQ